MEVKDMRIYHKDRKTEWHILGDILEVYTMKKGFNRNSVVNKTFEFIYPRDRFTKMHFPTDVKKGIQDRKNKQKVPSLLTQAARVMSTKDISKAKKYHMDPWVSAPTSPTLSRAAKGLDAVRTIQQKYRKNTKKRKYNSSRISRRGATRSSGKYTIRNSKKDDKSFINLKKNRQEKEFQKFLLNLHKIHSDTQTPKKK
jgi:hypothetical protein